MPNTGITPPISQNQLDLGAAAFFRPEAENPPGNQLKLIGGFIYQGGHAIHDKSSTQTTAGFSLVAVGFVRWDLVYVDSSGAHGTMPGIAVASGSSAYQGAPGWVGAGTQGPTLPDNIVPIAWVYVDETAGSVVVSPSDITEIRGLVHVGRQLDGYVIDKGLLGAAPSGSDDTVTSLFAGEVGGGSATAIGIITTPPLNYVDVVDSKNDGFVHAATGSAIYGRLTIDAYGQWILSYYYQDASGGESPVTDMAADTSTTPTDIRLVGVRKVFSRNDPARPLFDSAVARISDVVAGDVPHATTSLSGKVTLAANLGTSANTVVQATDDRVGAITVDTDTTNSGSLTSATANRKALKVIAGTNMTVTVTEQTDRIDIALSTTSFPGFQTSTLPLADSGSGNVGSSGLASHSDHVHPLSSNYGLEQNALVFDILSGTNVSVTTGFTPRLAMYWVWYGWDAEQTIGYCTAVETHSCYWSYGWGTGYAGSGVVNGVFSLQTSQIYGVPNTFNSTSVVAEQTTGATGSTITGMCVVLGDNLP